MTPPPVREEENWEGGRSGEVLAAAGERRVYW
jgi:hypothetical protein